MKKISALCLFPIFAFGQQSDSAFAESAPSFEDVSLPTEGDVNIPEHYRLRIRSLTTTYGDFRKIPLKFMYSDDDVTLSYIFPALCDNVISMSIGYEYNLYKQDEPFLFEENSFHNGFAALGLLNKSFNKLTLQGEASIYFNLDHRTADSNLVYLTGYGRYAITRCFGISLGAIYRTGIDQTRAWPIAGFDWIPNSNWELHLVYPIDLALVYNLNCCWSFSCNGRMINNRQRLDLDEYFSSGALQYQNYGIELDASYNWQSIIFAQLGIGYFLNGRLTFQCDHMHIKETLTQKNVPYLNAQVAIRF